MPVIQFALTVNEGKWLIAHAIARMPQVRKAMEEGRVVFKAGTTVSCVSQLMRPCWLAAPVAAPAEEPYPPLLLRGLM